MDIKAQSLNQQLDLLRRDYIKQLPAKIKKIHTLWSQILSDWNLQKIEELHRIIHTLKGSGGTFGIPNLTETANLIDIELKYFLQDGNSQTTHKLNVVSQNIETLNNIYQDANKAPYSYVPPENFDNLAPKENGEISIVYVCNQYNTENKLAKELEDFSYKVEVINEKEFLALTKPSTMENKFHIVILDMDNLNETGNLEQFIPLQHQTTSIPTICISTDSDIQQRLRAVRNGALAFFDKPLDINQLVDSIDRLAHSHFNNPYKIMIIDDSKSLAQAYATYLQHAGMETLVLSKPMTALDELVLFNPDLILLDLYMPRCSGPELARVIRQHPSFSRIPIVFLSAESDINKQLDAMSLGGDDFLTKPIQPHHLISTTSTRVERYRELRKFMERDSLTGLLNRGKIEQQLEIELSRAQRENQQLALALIDIDHFKLINDNHGHSVGDKTLKFLSRTLLKSLRKSDIVGRFGGEEFIVIFPNTNVSQARLVLDRIREQVQCVAHTSTSGKFFTTFSCGISGFPKYHNQSALSTAADEALYKAKNSGRNKVLAA